jgi:hypothetical protein
MVLYSLPPIPKSKLVMPAIGEVHHAVGGLGVSEGVADEVRLFAGSSFQLPIHGLSAASAGRTAKMVRAQTRRSFFIEELSKILRLGLDNYSTWKGASKGKCEVSQEKGFDVE